jgi:hypothetical protein
MAAVKVYLYDYFDRLLKRDRRSTDYATADAIAQMGATIIAESERVVDDELLDDEGVIRAAKMPPRDITRSDGRWLDQDENRAGPG